MQTIEIKNLKVNDIISKCVHCGFCLATCPSGVEYAQLVNISRELLGSK